MNIHLKSPEELAIMREAGRIVAVTHQAMREAVRPGVTTGELDKIAETVIRDHGAKPAFLGYPKSGAPNYPASITASVNNELVHGIPGKRVLKEGDIISLDVGTIYKGFVGDAAFSMGVGQIKAGAQRLLDVCEQSLYEGIKAAVLPNSVRDVAVAVQTYIEKHGYSVVRDYTGHGVGRTMHEDPQVPNWWPRKSKQTRGWVDVPLQPGMTFAIEPMVNTGLPDTRELSDQWTVVTRDGSLCAHFEHTIAITNGEPLILTLP
jgi:methionyl aminopeptidase